jgi:hypothetical protein
LNFIIDSTTISEFKRKEGMRMKGKKAILLAFILILAVHGVALGDGGAGLQSVSALPQDPRQNPNTVGAYIKGHFTVAYDKATPNQYTHHDLHAVLEWSMTQGKLKGWLQKNEKLYEVTDFKKRMTGVTVMTKPVKPRREMHLFSTQFSEPGGKALCEYGEDELMLKYWKLPMTLAVPEAFGVQGAETYITKLKIIKKDFCGASGTPHVQEPKAMIYGEIDIFIYK